MALKNTQKGIIALVSHLNGLPDGKVKMWNYSSYVVH